MTGEASTPRRGDGTETVTADGVRFARVGVLVWARPAYTLPSGDAVVWECEQCGALAVRPRFHARSHRRVR